MLKLNEDKTVLEGVLKLSDCEREFVVKWLSGSSQASLYIGDKPEDQSAIKDFIIGKHICNIDLNAFLDYLDKVKLIIQKYKSMYHGPLDKIDSIYSRFALMNPTDAKIVLDYVEDDRYIRILNDKSNYKINEPVYGATVLKNGDDFRHTFIGAITNIKIKKDMDEYTISINIIENWRDVIMEEKGQKVDLESITNIFNSEMSEGINDGKSEVESAQVFGIKYAPLLNINAHKFTYKEVVESSSYNKDEVLKAVENGMALSSSVLWAPDLVGANKALGELERTNIASKFDTCPRLHTGTNVILYGVPGAGKSWTIKSEYCDDENRMERLVFHPDYTYSDFVGQILPHIEEDGSVSYEFTPGPFTNLVKKAYRNPLQEYYLIIEEVNRGNAPAIFGDVFQLLDRDGREKIKSTNGSLIDNLKYRGSEYEITNNDIAKVVYEDENHKVTIPSNMHILCTMNTSDQNVFTLDTAFQRRWSMRLIKNKFREESSEKDFANTKILDTSVTWDTFFTEINKIILSKNIRMTSSEDKRLGTHFVSEEDLKYVEGDDRQNSRFPEKVLKYLWDDAFKFTKEDIFDLTKVKSLEDVIDIFTTSKKDDRFKVFKENIYKTFVKQDTNE